MITIQMINSKINKMAPVWLTTVVSEFDSVVRHVNTHTPRKVIWVPTCYVENITPLNKYETKRNLNNRERDGIFRWERSGFSANSKWTIKSSFLFRSIYSSNRNLRAFIFVSLFYRLCKFEFSFRFIDSLWHNSSSYGVSEFSTSFSVQES